MIVRVVESADLTERSECASGKRSRRLQVQIDDLDNTYIAEVAQRQRAAFEQDRGLLRAKKLAAETDRGSLSMDGGRKTEANGKLREASLVAVIPQDTQGRYQPSFSPPFARVVTS